MVPTARRKNQYRPGRPGPAPTHPGSAKIPLFRSRIAIIPSKVIFMTYVVTESCIKCKYTDCVEVCPVDCFREGPNMLVIDPEECIDCTLCVPECPADAIKPDT